MEKGKLYLIATPIGNLDDITLRAIKTIKEVDLIAAEDTRQTGKLLKYLEISKPMIIYHRHNEDTKKSELINLLKEGKNIGIITDAGTPGISDPGEVLVREAIKENIDVIPIPGACALINALIASGLATKEFTFYGFISLNNKLREVTLNDMKRQNKTIILYEAPHRILKTLEDLKSHFGDIYIVVAKELTKIHETFYRGKISELEKQLENPKGEFIILFENNSKTDEEIEIEEVNSLSLEEQYEYYKKKGLEKKEIIKKIAKNHNVNKNDIYKKFIEKK